MTSEQSAPEGQELAATPKQGENRGNAGKGRPKGSPNKTTALLKDAILLAAQKAGGDGEDGLVNYLQAQAIDNPGPFMGLLGKVLPMTVAGDPSEPIQVKITRVVLKPLE